MTKVELPASVVNTITLDGDGKRRSIEDSAGLRNLVWDAENILAETDSGGTTEAAYTLAPEAYGSLISQRRSGATSFHHYDALGSTNKLTDTNEATEVEYLYKAFGDQSILSGSHSNPFTWVGQLGYYRQADASDYWVRARIMDPKVGRWMSRDPAFMAHVYDGVVSVGGLYTYVKCRAVSIDDPSGLGSQPIKGLNPDAFNRVTKWCSADLYRSKNPDLKWCTECCHSIDELLGPPLSGISSGTLDNADCVIECEKACQRQFAPGRAIAAAGVLGLTAYIECYIISCMEEAFTSYLDNLKLRLGRSRRRPPSARRFLR